MEHNDITLFESYIGFECKNGFNKQPRHIAPHLSPELMFSVNVEVRQTCISSNLEHNTTQTL